jgi:threonine/homoserine/homoserine lactone efflux protein
MVTNVALMYANSNGVLTVLLGFAALNLPCILIWAALGDRLRSHLQVAWKRQAFNSLMALSLVATTGWMLYDAVLLS